MKIQKCSGIEQVTWSAAITVLVMLFVMLTAARPASAAVANYTGTVITNHDQSADGIFTGTTTVTATTGNISAVLADQNGISLSLTGDIRIDAGHNNNDTDPTDRRIYAKGVNALNGGTISLNGNITLDIAGLASSGVVSGPGSRVILDASTGTQPIRITLSNTLATNASSGVHSINTKEAAAVYSTGGSIRITGDSILSAGQVRGYGLWTNNGDIQVTGNTKITTTGQGGYGIRADSGLVNLDGSLTIDTSGNQSANTLGMPTHGAYGVKAGLSSDLGLSGTLNVTGTTAITTTGTAAYALYAVSDGSRITLGHDNTLTTIGANSHAIYATDATLVSLGTNTRITTTGANALGAIAASGARIDLGTNTSLATTGNGLEATGTGSLITGTRVLIDSAAWGVNATTGANVILTNATIRAAGYGIASYMQSTTMKADGFHVEAGDLAAISKWGGTLILSSGTLVSTTRDGLQIVGGDSYARLTDVEIHSAIAGIRITEGSRQSADLENVTIFTSGSESGYGIQADQRSTINARNLTIATESDKSRGIYSALGSDINLTGTINIHTKGNDAHGLLARYAGAASLNDTRITADAASTLNIRIEGGSPAAPTHGVFAQQIAGDIYDARIALDGVTNIQLTATAFGNALNATGSTASITAARGSIDTANPLGHAAAALDGGNIAMTNFSIRATGSGAAGLAVSQNGSITFATGSIATAGPALLLATGTISITDGALASATDIIHATGTLANTATLTRVTATTAPNLLNATGTGANTITALASTLSGDLRASDATQNTVTLDNATTLAGAALQAHTATLDLALLNNSSWNMTATSTLNRLSLPAGTRLRIAPPATPGDFKTLTINDDLHGGGEITINTRLGDDTSPTDKLIINSNATGQTTLTVENAGGAGAQTTQGIQIIQVAGLNASGSDTFHLAHDVIAGAYAYDLFLEADNNWYLKSIGLAPDHAPDINTAVAAHAGWFTDLDNLHKRMGELRLTQAGALPVLDNTWARAYGFQTNINLGMDGIRNFDQTDYGIDIGADHRWNPDRNAPNTYYTGLFAGYGNATRDFKTEYDGSTDTLRLGAYATWLHTDGWYADLVFKADFDSHDIDGAGRDVSYDTRTQGVSLEFGRQFMRPNGWWLEPSVQAAVAWANSADYDYLNPDSGLTVRVDLASATVTEYRGLVRFGRQIKDSNWHPYAKIGATRTITNGGAVSIAGDELRPNLDGWTAVLGLGTQYAIGEHTQLYLDYEYQKATRYERPWLLNFGWRKDW